jgi:hypothetical protein
LRDSRLPLQETHLTAESFLDWVLTTNN